MKNPNLDLINKFNDPLFTSEEISQGIGISADVIRQWVSRKAKMLDAEIGVRGRRILYSPSDMLKFLIISRFSHIQIAFKGDSFIERKYLNPDGTPVDRWTLEDEICGQISQNVYSLIYDLGQEAIGAEKQFVRPGVDLSSRRYFVIFFNADKCQIVNGKKATFGRLDFALTGDPLAMDCSEGVILVVDCFRLSRIIIDSYKGIG